MRIVTVCALNHALIDPVFRWHFELRALGRVAAEAKLGLLLRKQELRCCGSMDGMATGADDIGVCMGRIPDIGA